MASGGSNRVAGEASESDEEYEINQSYFMKNTMVVNEETTSNRKGIVVEGEASESDEDDDIEEKVLDINTVVGDSLLKDEAKSSPDEPTKRKVKFHYDSFFHRRLRVSNLELRSDVVENTVNMYKEANTKLQSAVFHLNRSQASVQDIFSNMALISGDLQSLTDTLDKVLSRDHLPTLKMNVSKPRTIEPVGT